MGQRGLLGCLGALGRRSVAGAALELVVLGGGGLLVEIVGGSGRLFIGEGGRILGVGGRLLVADGGVVVGSRGCRCHHLGAAKGREVAIERRLHPALGILLRSKPRAIREGRSRKSSAELWIPQRGPEPRATS